MHKSYTMTTTARSAMPLLGKKLIPELPHARKVEWGLHGMQNDVFFFLTSLPCHPWVLQTASSRPWTSTGDGTTGTFHKSHSKQHAQAGFLSSLPCQPMSSWKTLQASYVGASSLSKDWTATASFETVKAGLHSSRSTSMCTLPKTEIAQCCTLLTI
mmetsp:Transcript_84301/g.167396  ORF Transcript_84301/g.167396 Transcript_84301/m.167396 type:complete len:157 (-) Transcript_84301:1098-1568(-)